MRRGPAPRQYRQERRRSEVSNRLAWYFYEYGRPPTVDELFAIRAYREDTDPRYYPPNR